MKKQKKHSTNMESINSISKKSGLPPGTLVHVGEKHSEVFKISVIDYTEENATHHEIENIADCKKYIHTNSVSWFNVIGLHDVEKIAAIGEQFELHSLILEDVVNTGHRPKHEVFENCQFLTFKMLGIKPNGKKIASEQLSVVLGKGWVISFQEQEGDVFDKIRQRISEGAGKIRSLGADYLFYRLIDTTVDHYFYVTDFFSAKTEKLEEEVLTKHNDQLIGKIQTLKKTLLTFKKNVIPLRDAISPIPKDPSGFISEEISRYFTDIHDHLVQLNDNIETQKEILSSILDLYFSGISNKTNQVMQVLTIISIIFMPLTFIAGIYGMNFENIPELKWHYGYFGVWGVMITITLVMIAVFKRRKWL